VIPALTPACALLLPRLAASALREATRSFSVPLPLEAIVIVPRPILSAAETIDAARALVQLVARAQLGQIRGRLAVARAVRSQVAWLRTHGTVYSRSEAYLTDAEYGARSLEVAS